MKLKKKYYQLEAEMHDAYKQAEGFIQKALAFHLIHKKAIWPAFVIGLLLGALLATGA